MRVARPTALTGYKLVRGPGAVFTADWQPRRLIDIRDGTSNTVAVAESGPPVPWTRPADLAHPGPLPPGPYTDGVSLGFADGSVRTFRRPLPDDLLRLLVLADDGGLIPDDRLARAGAPSPPLNPAEAAELAKVNARTAAARDKLVAELADLARELQALPPAADPRAAERIENAVRELGDQVKRARSELRPR